MKEGKAFHISQKEVLNAYKAVKANKGAGGIDGIELEEFDKDWKNRLYVLWNRMSSGSYYSKPVRGVEIPKKNGKKRGWKIILFFIMFFTTIRICVNSFWKFFDIFIFWVKKCNSHDFSPFTKYGYVASFQPL